MYTQRKLLAKKHGLRKADLNDAYVSAFRHQPDLCRELWPPALEARHTTCGQAMTVTYSPPIQRACSPGQRRPTPSGRHALHACCTLRSWDRPYQDRRIQVERKQR